MNPDYFLRAGVIVSAAVIVGAVEMRRRARVTGAIARRWLDDSGYRVAPAARMNINVWVNPARVVVRAQDARDRAVDVALTVKWLMAGVAGEGDVTCTSVKEVPSQR